MECSEFHAAKRVLRIIVEHRGRHERGIDGVDSVKGCSVVRDRDEQPSRVREELLLGTADAGKCLTNVWHNRAAAVDAPFENALSAAPRSCLCYAAGHGNSHAHDAITMDKPRHIHFAAENNGFVLGTRPVSNAVSCDQFSR